MARTAQIHYKRVTFSFPADVLLRLREKVESQRMSQYVTEAVEEKMISHAEENVNKFMSGLNELVDELQESRVDKRSSLEILREIRHGKK